ARRSSLLAKLEVKYPRLRDAEVASAALDDVQSLGHQGYSIESADGSFDLRVRRHLGWLSPAFRLEHYRGHGIGTAQAPGGDGDAAPVEATVKLEVGGASGPERRLCVAEGNGPVDALSHALRQALDGIY